jgi:hypothetical protein
MHRNCNCIHLRIFKMAFYKICILVSSLSFFFYVVSYFTSTHMKKEFERFNLEKLGLLTIVLEFIGALGLLVGLKYPIILALASFGLALLMFFGLIVRIKIKDQLWVCLPVLFYLVLNAYIFYNVFKTIA